MKAGVLLLSALLVLAGCTDGSPSAPPSSSSTPGAGLPGTDTTTVVATPTASAITQPVDQAALVSFIRAGTPVNAGPYTFGDGSVVFAMPSRNIRCVSFNGGGMCLIDDAPGWPAAGVQACAEGSHWVDKMLEYSQDGTRRGRCFVEEGYLDMSLQVLPYGSTVFDHGIACRSESEFLACVNLDSGNGFLMARGFYRVYGTALSPQGNV